MKRRLLIAGSFRVLTRYKARTFFMSLGIVIGVAALVVMRSIGSGAERNMTSRIERMFSATSVMVTNTGGARHGGGRRATGKLTIEDLEAIADELDQVVDWDPMVVVGAGDREVQYKGATRSLMILGHSERAEVVWDRGVTEGEFFSEADVRSAARVALLGYKAAEALFGDESPIGRQIRIGDSPFRVKGILEPHGVDPHGLDKDDEVHVPITTLMRRLLNLDRIGSAKLLVADAEAIEDTADRIAEILRARHGLADEQPDDFSIFTPTLVRERVAEANRVLAVYLPATAGIALLVAAIVIANIMRMAVRERIAEIGLRKAVGATDRQIGWQFLLESLAVTGLSGVLGVGLGAGILALVAGHGGPEAGMAPDAVFLGLTAALLVGALAGYLPARQAARQEPVDALR
jgi:putative ABC transport system permease protein